MTVQKRDAPQINAAVVAYLVALKGGLKPSPKKGWQRSGDAPLVCPEKHSGLRGATHYFSGEVSFSGDVRSLCGRHTHGGEKLVQYRDQGSECYDCKQIYQASKKAADHVIRSTYNRQVNILLKFCPHCDGEVSVRAWRAKLKKEVVHA